MKKQFETRSIKNPGEFSKAVELIGKIDEDKVLLSSDVKALFSSISVKKATAVVKDWFLQQHGDSQWRGKIKQSTKLAKISTTSFLGVSIITS